MATIIVQNGPAKVVLTEPDEDGDYSWVCACGAELDAWRPQDEAINYAEGHVDIQCPLIKEAT